MLVRYWMRSVLICSGLVENIQWRPLQRKLQSEVRAIKSGGEGFVGWVSDFWLKFRPRIAWQNVFNLFKKMKGLIIETELLLDKVIKLYLVTMLELIGYEVLHHVWYILIKLSPGFCMFLYWELHLRLTRVFKIEVACTERLHCLPPAVIQSVCWLLCFNQCRYAFPSCKAIYKL